jgi:ubiquitin carboxyl-terminal hydrolase L3
MSSQKRWFPLESNPEIMNRYIRNLGVEGDYEFTDVFGLDDDLLLMVPQPVLAILLLYPITKENESAHFKKDQEIATNGQTLSNDVYFLKQTVGNACGTVGIIHAIANNKDKFTLKDDAFFKEFLTSTGTQSADERAKALEQNEKVEVAHGSSAQEGVQSFDMDTNLHFVCFVEKNGHLYELDGRRPQPVNHGPTTTDNLLYDAAKVVRQYMEINPNEVNWSIVALSAAQ